MSHPLPSWKPITDTEQEPPASVSSGKAQGAGFKESSRSVLLELVTIRRVLVLLSLVGTQRLHWSTQWLDTSTKRHPDV